MQRAVVTLNRGSPERFEIAALEHLVGSDKNFISDKLNGTVNDN